MTDTMHTRTDAFVEKLQAFLAEEVLARRLSFFVCNVTARSESVSTFINGARHSKAPNQSNILCEVDLNFRLAENEAAALTFSGFDFDSFKTHYARARILAFPLAHHSSVRKHKEYPQLQLASAELLAALGREGGARELAQIAAQLDGAAAKVTHPHLMNREVSTSLSLARRSYFDSAGNVASEELASCGLTCVFNLRDSSEYASDALGVLPTEEDCQKVVAEASKTLQNVETKSLEKGVDYVVCLTPKALISLVSDLVLPNLEVRSILDGTGAWEVDALGSRVLVEGLTLKDNPHLAHSPFSAAFDVEGSPTRPVTLMDNGVLAHPLFTSSLLAELAQAHPKLAERFALTGHAQDVDRAQTTNLTIELKAPRKVASQAELLALSPHVVLVNGLTGMSVDPLTGQFALDSEGAKVYNQGKLQSSTSFTLRGNLFEALAHQGNVTGPQERFYSSWAPSLLTHKLTCVVKDVGNPDELSADKGTQAQ